MTQESLVELVTLAQAGDQDALETVLIWAYTPITFLCKKILKDKKAVQAKTQELLYMLSRKIDTLQDPAQFQNWIARLTIAMCLQELPEKPKAEAKDTLLPIVGETLNQEQTIDAVQRMVDMLPDDPRICITLLCCSDLRSRDIAQATKCDVETVHKNMAEAQGFVMEQIEKYSNLGTTLYPIESLKEVMLTAMYHPRDEKEAMAAVYRAIGKELPAPKEVEKKAEKKVKKKAEKEPKKESEPQAEAPVDDNSNRGIKILLKVLIGIMTLMILALIGLNIWAKNFYTYSVEDFAPLYSALPAEYSVPETTVAEAAETLEPTEEAAIEATEAQA